jgi:7-cyano-7-deazaguanine synthase in queuosine biosynthesis
MPTKSLVLFSGGLDSTYVLYKMLSETDDEITAITFQRDYDSELYVAYPPLNFVRLPKLIEELRKIRNFNHSIKTVTEEEMNPNTDHTYTYFISYAAPFLNDGTYDRIVTGRTAEQWNKFVKVSDEKIIKGSPTNIAATRLWRNTVTRGEVWNPLQNNAWHTDFNRWHVNYYLPSNLYKLTLSCNRPISVDDGTWNKSCGQCYKCLWDEKVTELIELGFTSEMIDNWRKDKAYYYGSRRAESPIWAPMRIWLPIEMGKGNIYRGIDTLEKCREFVRKGPSYSLKRRANKEGTIWDMSDLSDMEGVDLI